MSYIYINNLQEIVSVIYDIIYTDKFGSILVYSKTKNSRCCCSNINKKYILAKDKTKDISYLIKQNKGILISNKYTKIH